MGLFGDEDDEPTPRPDADQLGDMPERIAVSKREWEELKEERQRLMEKVEQLEGGPFEYYVDEPWVKVEYDVVEEETFTRYHGKAVFAVDGGTYMVKDLTWDEMKESSGELRIKRYCTINDYGSLKAEVVARLDAEKLLAIHPTDEEEETLSVTKREEKELPREDLKDFEAEHDNVEIVDWWHKEVREMPPNPEEYPYEDDEEGEGKSSSAEDSQS